MNLCAERMLARSLGTALKLRALVAVPMVPWKRMKPIECLTPQSNQFGVTLLRQVLVTRLQPVQLAQRWFMTMMTPGQRRDGVPHNARRLAGVSPRTSMLIADCKHQIHRLVETA
jgi:hypothetical protein